MWHRNLLRALVGVSVMLAAVSVQAPAQGSGTIKGKVVDASTDDGLPGANVFLAGTSMGTATDLDGNFILRLVPPGPWTVTVSFVGYESHKEDVVVIGGEVLEKNFRITPKVLEGQEVVITGQALGQAEAINQQIASNKIVSVVSEARIQELPDFNAAQALARLPGVSTLQSSGEANKVVIRGLSPQFNQVAVGGITLASTGGTQIGVSSLENTSGQINTDRSVDLTMITPYMIKSVEVYKSLTPDMNANAIGGFVNMNLREAPVGLKSDILLQTGYTQKSGKYGNYRIVGAVSNRFLNNDLGVYLLANTEQYDRNADNMNANYDTQGSIAKADGFRPVEVQNVQLNRHVEQRNRYGGNLILDYQLPSGSIKFVNVLSRLESDAQDYRTIIDYKFRNLTFRYREGVAKTDAAVNSVEFNNDFGLISMELKVANSYSRNYSLHSPQFSFQHTSGTLGTITDVIPESLVTNIR
jgi:TonB-dependent receptor